MKKLINFLVITLCFGDILAQKSILPAPVNSILYNETDPILNGKGNVMILKTESAQEPAPYWSITTSTGNVWATPTIVDALNFSNKTIKNLSPSLNFEGNQIYFSSDRFGGIGSGDIWMLGKIGNNWPPKPTNLGMPVNSPEYESDPYFAPDGKTLYFIRQTSSKTNDGIPCGDIYTTVLSGKTWTKPQKLPSPINTGCECKPQMLNDNKTLIFGSQRTGGKGSYDIYMSQLNENGTWSDPLALTFYNTAKDDRGISIPAQGNIMYCSVMGKSSKDIIREVLPNEFQPVKTHVLTVKSLGSDHMPINSKLTVKNLNSKIAKDYLIYNNRENIIFLYSPNTYELVYQDPTNKYLHHTDFVDFSSLKAFEYQTLNVTLEENQKLWQASLLYLFNEDLSINPKYIEELKRIDKITESKNDSIEIILNAQDYTDLDSSGHAILHQNISSILRTGKLFFASNNDSSGLIAPNSKEAIIRFKK